MKKYVSASILSADFLELKNEITKTVQSGADMLHFDVMDGIFVNNISFGFPLLKAVKKCSPLCLDVHLMISSPLKYAADFVHAGADIVTFHAECPNISETIRAIADNGAKPGLALRPGTPLETALPYLDKLGLLLIMTVEPGFGGQSYIPEMTDKIRMAKKYIRENRIDTLIQVDGGINDQTAAYAAAAGADILVAGNYLFGAESMKTAAEKLRAAFI